MKKEIHSAVEFITGLLKRRIVTQEKVETFTESLENVLCSHYEDHWFPEKSCKGSGYRCMRIVNRKMDPLISKAGKIVGLSDKDLLDVLPAELTLWVDPEEVSYRIGEDGSIGVLYEESQNNSQSSVDSDTDSSASGSLSSSPSPLQHHPHHPQEYLSFQQQACKDQQTRMHFPYSQPYTQDAPLSHWEYLATFVAS